MPDPVGPPNPLPNIPPISSTTPGKMSPEELIATLLALGVCLAVIEQAKQECIKAFEGGDLIRGAQFGVAISMCVAIAAPIAQKLINEFFPH